MDPLVFGIIAVVSLFIQYFVIRAAVGGAIRANVDAIAKAAQAGIRSARHD